MTSSSPTLLHIHIALVPLSHLLGDSLCQGRTLSQCPSRRARCHSLTTPALSFIYHTCAVHMQVVSTTLAGAALGSLTGGACADAFGRRASFMLCALPMLAGPLLSAAATSFATMAAGRFLAGIAIGLSSALVPLYISEVHMCRRMYMLLLLSLFPSAVYVCMYACVYAPRSSI